MTRKPADKPKKPKKLSIKHSKGAGRPTAVTAQLTMYREHADPVVVLGKIQRRQGEKVLVAPKGTVAAKAAWMSVLPPSWKSMPPEILAANGQSCRITGEAGRQLLLHLQETITCVTQGQGQLVTVKRRNLRIVHIEIIGSGNRFSLRLFEPGRDAELPLQELSVQPTSTSGLRIYPGEVIDFGRVFSEVEIQAYTATSDRQQLSLPQLVELVTDLCDSGNGHLLDPAVIEQIRRPATAEAPVPVIKLVPHPLWDPTQRLTALLHFEYPAGVGGTNPEAEKQALNELMKSKAIFPDSLSGGYYALSKRLVAAVPVLAKAGWRIESGDGRLDELAIIEVSVIEKQDWFDLHIELRYGRFYLPLAEALRLQEQGQESVQLEDGSTRLLPLDILARLRVLVLFGQNRRGDSFRIARRQGALLQALVDDQSATVSLSAEASCRAAIARLSMVPPTTTLSPPPGFKGTLRPYQQYGLSWLHYLRQNGIGGILADDMGLGKTVQLLALLAGIREDGQDPGIIVAPVSLLLNWQQEAARFAPELTVHILHAGINADRDDTKAAGYDLLLTTYGILRSRTQWLAEQTFSICILDEAQSIKNADTQTARAARQIRADFRLCLTGTPVENHLGDIWSLLDFVNPGLLGSAAGFQKIVADPAMAPGSPAVAAFSRLIHPFILRRTKAQVLPDLPPKTEMTLYCELEGAQRETYDTLLTTIRSEMLGNLAEQDFPRIKIRVIEALLRLRQCACHAGLVDKSLRATESAKFELLMARLTELRQEGHKVLVFSQFTTLLALFQQRLESEGILYSYLDGKTSKRQEAVDRFQQDSEIGVFLISLKAGGTGLNLTAASYVFILDPWWNPATEQQAIDRAHRIGQQQPVFAYRLVARNTIEEKILKLQHNKRALADAILSADKSVMKQLTADDLRALLQ